MVLVTGATGILGRVIVLNLLEKGFEVKATKRPSSNLEEVKNSWLSYNDNSDEYFKKVQWVNVDLDDLNSLKTILDGVTEVYHCAAKVSFNPKLKKELYNTNINGTKNLLYACEGSSVNKFCFISSIAVLNEFNENGELDEESHFNPNLEHSDYVRSKYFSEMEVWRASAEGLNTVIILPGIILGSGNWKSKSGHIFGNFEKTLCAFPDNSIYVDVRDVANISIQLMEKNIFGERFLVVNESSSYINLATKVRAKLGLPRPKTITNILLYFSRIFRIFGFLIPQFKMLNKNYIELWICNKKVSNKKIKDRLGYQFIPIEETIDFHLNNYINYKKLNS